MTQITITGNVTRDPELRFTTSGTAVTSFAVAVNRGTKEKDNQETDFYDVSCWEDQAEQVAEKVSKGDRVIVTGQYKSRKYKTNSGEDRTGWAITAWEVGLSLKYAPRDSQSTGRSPAKQPYNPEEEPF